MTKRPLDRDAWREYFRLNPTKACRECGVEKPNDFANFGKKLYLTRNTYITNDVCFPCRTAKTADVRRASRVGASTEALDLVVAMQRGKESK